MSPPSAALLPDRGLLSLAGDDRATFLQGLVTNDVHKLNAETALHAALLTPQGKMLFDLFLAPAPAPLGEAIMIEAESARLDDLRARLLKYKLRARVTLAPAADWRIGVLWGTGVAAALGLPDRAGATRELGHDGRDGIAFMDPRLAVAGARLVLPSARAEAVLAQLGATPADPADWDAHRLRLGLPDGGRDMVVDKSTALECGLDDLAGVDFRKGCYMGQELTARTRYRGLLKRRLMPVRIRGPLPAPGTPLTTADGKAAGEMRSGLALAAGGPDAPDADQGGLGMAIVRLDALGSDAPLACGDATVTPVVPDWMRLPAPQTAPQTTPGTAG